MEKIAIGTECEWNALINGKITRLTGIVTDIVNDNVKIVSVTKIDGYRFTDIVNVDNLITNSSKSSKSKT